jgi:hypothetical protein
MIAAALLVALAQEPRRANDLPLRNDCTLGLSKTAGDELARGDALAASSAQAFDAWHASLLLGAADAGALVPLPADQGGEARGGESAELAVLRRLALLGEPGWRAWRARFEELARGELAQVPHEEDALERFVAAHAGTESTQRAALRLADLARERGDEQGARAALRRARAQGPLEAALADALARRTPPQSAARTRAVPRLEPLFVLELTPEEARDDWIPARRAGAALAELGDGRILWWTAGALRGVDEAGKSELFDLAALSRAPSWSWVPPFRDGPSPWTPALIARGTRAWLLLGRARGSEGNVFAALEFAPRAQPVLAWAWDASGLRLGDDESARVLPAGLWEYQPGACESAGRVCLLARRYASAPDARPQVDELHAETWCLCLDGSSGALVWQRKLGQGADPATRDPARRPEARGFCTGADPLALADGRLWCSTGLSWLSVLDLPEGRVLASWRAGLEAEELGTRALVLPPASEGASVLWQPAASSWSYRAEAGGDFQLQPGDGSTRLALAAGRAWSIRNADGAVRIETRLAGVPGARASVALARGELPQAILQLGPETLALATGRALYLFDDRDQARLVERAVLPRGAAQAAGGSGSLCASGERITCAVGSALAAWRVR